MQREILRHNNINALLKRRLVSLKTIINVLIETLRCQKPSASLSSINPTFSKDFLLAKFKVLISAISFDTNGNKFTNDALFSFLFQLLQNLGKADKTTDEIFEEHLLNFNQQQANSCRLQKDIANYIRCIKGITYLYRSPYIIIKGQGRRN